MSKTQFLPLTPARFGSVSSRLSMTPRVFQTSGTVVWASLNYNQGNLCLFATACCDFGNALKMALQRVLLTHGTATSSARSFRAFPTCTPVGTSASRISSTTFDTLSKHTQALPMVQWTKPYDLELWRNIWRNSFKMASRHSMLAFTGAALLKCCSSTKTSYRGSKSLPCFEPTAGSTFCDKGFFSKHPLKACRDGLFEREC